ncbi:MAG: C39 family peptidase [Candidatus Kerfeldbacteria bacterium]|nr:C39 family peptidase [Candidatus Kerfeldbacteria bacterium]
MLNVPFFSQETEFFCGPACVQMILAAFSVSAQQEELASLLHTTRDGTLTRNIPETIKRFGLSVIVECPSTIQLLKQHLINDCVVMVNFIEPRENLGHYIIVVEASTSHLVYHDPEAGPNQQMLISEFMPRWQAESEPVKQWLLAVEKRK